MRKNYFSKNLKYFIKNGLDRKDLAYVSNVSVGSIKNYEINLTQNPNIITICKIAKALELTVEELVNKDFGEEVVNFDFMYDKKPIDIINLNLSKNVGEFIRSNNYNFNKASQMLKTNETTIRKIRLSEDKTIRLEVCIKMANCMNITLDQLLFEEIKF